MHLLLVHNYYRDPGGEDDVFESERALLRQHGHEVSEYVRSNREIRRESLGGRVSAGGQAFWSRRTYREMRALLRERRPDVAHFHNTFPLISPSAYYACRDAGVPVVQMLHNSRLLCPSGNFYRAGRMCTDCMGQPLDWPGVVHGCYQGSRMRTAAVAGMIAWHQLAGTWKDAVDLYVVFTEFFRQQFIAGGFSAEKLAVKPQFLDPDPGARPAEQYGEYALFVGRLVGEKGVTTLAEAWRGLDIPLRIRGEGPLQPMLEGLARDHAAVQLTARPTRQEYFELIKGARFLVWPSEGLNETFGRVAMDAFACGVPVLAARIGANTEMVSEGRTGLAFAAGNAVELADKARWAWEHPDELRALGRNGRAEYEAKYTAGRNYQLLMQLYDRVLGRDQTQAEKATA